MKKFIDKLIGRLEEVAIETLGISKGQFAMDEGEYSSYCSLSLCDVKEQVNQLAEEYNNEQAKGDLISRRELTEKVQTYFYENRIHQNDLAEVIVNLPTAYNGGWIPCEKELPPRNESVLCWAVSKARGGDCCCLGSCDNGFWFIQTQIDTYSFPTQYEVVAWHRLPAPYKEEGE